MPFFSIIIPLYNKENFIVKTVQSALNQTYADFEIIIINDGSTDGSLKALNELTDSRIKIFTIKNQGVSFARNYGIEKASGAFIVFLDADDLFKNDHLEKIHFLINDCPLADVFCTNYLTKYSKKSTKKNNFKGLEPSFRGYIKNYFGLSNYNAILLTGNAGFKTTIFNKSNLFFDENMKSGQDTDLWVRIGLKYKFAIDTSAFTFIYNKTDNSLSSSCHVSDRILLLNKYKEQEEENTDFKKYMDLNRYAVGLNYRLNKKNSISKSILKDINFDYLNTKQKILIKMPAFLIAILLKIKFFMARNGVFMSLYK